MKSGIESAWKSLAGLDPDDVAKRAGAHFNTRTNHYHLECYGMEVSIDPGSRTISSNAPGSSQLLEKLKHFSSLSILWYLARASDIPASGKLVKPSDLREGQIYYQGSHVLPLNGLAAKFGSNKTGFLERGHQLAGKREHYGDASITLLPLPRLPVTFILWESDDEFPARADILFDSTCEQHVPADIIWSVAMMSVLMMMA